MKTANLPSPTKAFSLLAHLSGLPGSRLRQQDDSAVVEKFRPADAEAVPDLAQRGKILDIFEFVVR